MTLSSCNALASLPVSMGDLASLQDLDLQVCNHLTALPDFIGRSPRSENLNVGYRQTLASLPVSVDNLAALQDPHLQKRDHLIPR